MYRYLAFSFCVLAACLVSAFSNKNTSSVDNCAAVYSLTQYRGFQPIHSKVVYARIGDYRLRIQEDSGIADAWKKTHTGFVLYRFFLNEERSIYYEPADFLSRTAPEHWDDIDLFFPKSWLELPYIEQRQYLGHTTHTHSGQKIEATWFPALKLPKHTRIKNGSQWQELRFEGFTPIAPLQKKLQRYLAFDITDFADIGDNEHDPFFASMIRQGFIEHTGACF